MDYDQPPEAVQEEQLMEETEAVVSNITIENKPSKLTRKRRVRRSSLGKSVKVLPHGTPRFVRTIIQNFRHQFKPYNLKFDPSRIMPVMLTDRALEVGSSAYKFVLFSEFSQSYETLLYIIINFSQTIPGFEHLHNDDRMILIKTGLTDVWLILLAKRLFAVKGCVTLEDSSIVPNSELYAIYSKEYIQELKKTANRIKKMALTIPERALLVCAILACPDRPNLIDPQKIDDLQSTYLRAIVVQSTLSKSKTPREFAELKSVLQAVYDIGKKHADQINVYRKNCERLTVPPVVKELFDLNPSSVYKEKNEK